MNSMIHWSQPWSGKFNWPHERFRTHGLLDSSSASVVNFSAIITTNLMTPADVAFLHLISTHTGKLKLPQLIIFRFSASRLFVCGKKSGKCGFLILKVFPTMCATGRTRCRRFKVTGQCSSTVGTLIHLFIFHLEEISVEWGKLEQQSVAQNKEDAAARVSATLGESFHMAALISFLKPSVKWKGKPRAPFLCDIYFNQLRWRAADDFNLNVWRWSVATARRRNSVRYPDELIFTYWIFVWNHAPLFIQWVETGISEFLRQNIRTFLASSPL